MYLLLFLPLVVRLLVIRTYRLVNRGERQGWPRWLWSRIPRGFFGVVVRGGQVQVLQPGARVVRPFSVLTQIDTRPTMQTVEPFKLSSANGDDLVGRGTVRFQVTHPAALMSSPWGRSLPLYLGALTTVASREAVAQAGTDPRVQPELVSGQTRRPLRRSSRHPASSLTA